MLSTQLLDKSQHQFGSRIIKYINIFCIDSQIQWKKSDKLWYNV